MDTSPTQYVIDPATGGWRVDPSHEVADGRWVCPNCQTVNVGPRCVNMTCGWPGEDDDSPPEPTDVYVDPPGGEAGP